MDNDRSSMIIIDYDGENWADMAPTFGCEFFRRQGSCSMNILDEYSMNISMLK